MAIILFFILFFFAKPVFAAPLVNITVAPTTAISGSTIPVQFTIENSDPSTSYHYKIFGGIGSSETQIQTTESLAYRDDWDTFPTITVDSSGRKSIDTTAYIKPTNPTGSYNLFVRIAKADTHSSTYDSSGFVISITGPTPTIIPTLTSAPTPTTDPTIVNPTSGVSMTEFMPYSDPEWIEIRNSNDKPVKLVGWKLEDKDGHTRNISDITIGANSNFVFEYSAFFDNNNNETVIFRRQDNTIITQTSYSGGLRTIDRSWSLINNSWCQSSITKGYGNVTSCYSAPTNTPTPTPTKSLSPTPTPDLGKYTPDESATASAIIDPLNESTSLPANTPTPIPQKSSILGQTNQSSKTKKNYLPLIFILAGGGLLVSPLILNKIKKK